VCACKQCVDWRNGSMQVPEDLSSSERDAVLEALGAGKGPKVVLELFPFGTNGRVSHPKTVSVGLLYLVLQGTVTPLQSQPEIQVVVNAERSVPLLTGEGCDPGFARRHGVCAGVHAGQRRRT
jgi:hypothetical protein